MSTPTLQDLLDLLPDNTTGQISAADLRQVVSVLWVRSGAAGHVDSGGALVSGPPGWSASRTSPGVYIVQHGLGIDPERYSVAITPMQLETQAPVLAVVLATTPASFTFAIADVAGVPTSRDASFVMGVN